MSRRTVTLCVIGVGLGLVVAAAIWTPVFHPLKLSIFGRASVADRLAQYGESARTRLKPYFANAQLAYPPQRFAFVVRRNRALRLEGRGSCDCSRRLASQNRVRRDYDARALAWGLACGDQSRTCSISGDGSFI
jgi:hypothetical protein